MTFVPIFLCHTFIVFILYFQLNDSIDKGVTTLNDAKSTRAGEKNLYIHEKKSKNDTLRFAYTDR